jgi:parallel beta-helix repeat protein
MSTGLLQKAPKESELLKRTVLTLLIILALLMLLVAGAQFKIFSSANFFPDPGPDLPRIYIRSNGSVEPATAPIERAGNLYKLTDNIAFFTIEIQRDNIVLDGAGRTVQGNASRIKGYDDGNNGVIVAGHNNVNITHLSFEQGDTGIRVSKSSNVNIVGNTFRNGINKGISLQESTYSLIEDNNFIDVGRNDQPAVLCSGSKNTIRNNRLIGSIRGIDLEGQSNIILGNKIESVSPIIMDLADSNVIARNKITGPAYQNFTGSEGIALFRNCSNNIIFGNNITGFKGQAIRTVWACSNNTIYGNYMANNGFAVALYEGAVNNIFYGNTFAVDSCNISGRADLALWDNGTIGNYWGNYNGADSNGDGIGDAPYTVNGFKWDNDVGGLVSFVADQDNYPLMAPYDIEHDTVVLPPGPPFQTVLVMVVSVIAVVGVGAGLLFYHKKRKGSRNP